jgi:hypothetical protein
VHDVVFASIAGNNIQMIILASKWVLVVTMNIENKNQSSAAKTVTVISPSVY